MSRLTRRALFASSVLICVFTLIISAAAAHEVAAAAHPATLHFQTTRAATNNTTVTNTLTVPTSSISLGSTIDAQGKVTVGTQPLANARVALHLGDVVLATTQTDATGAYAFSAPVGFYYFPAALAGSATVYSVATSPSNASITAPSGVTNVAINELPLYALIAVVVIVVLGGLYAFTRRRRHAVGPAEETPAPSPSERPAAPAPSKTAVESQPSEPPKRGPAVPVKPSTEPTPEPKPEEPTTPAAPSPPSEEHAAPSGDRTTEPKREPERAEKAVSSVSAEHATLTRARALFQRGQDCQAINALYDEAITVLVSASGTELAPHMTYWEKYDAIETAMPEVRAPLRRLTLSYELCHYRDKPLVKEDQDAALEAFRSIMGYVDKRTRAE